MWDSKCWRIREIQWLSQESAYDTTTEPNSHKGSFVVASQHKHTHLDGCPAVGLFHKETKCFGYCISWLLGNSFRTSIRIAIAYQDRKLLGNGWRNRWWWVEACHETYHGGSLISNRMNQFLLPCKSIVSFDTRRNKQRPSIDPSEAIEIPK